LSDIVATQVEYTTVATYNDCGYMKTVMLRLRIEPEFKEQLEEAVRNGKAASMSELIRKAVNEFLKTTVQD